MAEPRKPLSDSPGAERRGGKQTAKTTRRRKYEAATEELHPEDRPSRKLAIDPIAVVDLMRALGYRP